MKRICFSFLCFAAWPCFALDVLSDVVVLQDEANTRDMLERGLQRLLELLAVPAVDKTSDMREEYVVLLASLGDAFVKISNQEAASLQPYIKRVARFVPASDDADLELFVINAKWKCRAQKRVNEWVGELNARIENLARRPLSMIYCSEIQRIVSSFKSTDQSFELLSLSARRFLFLLHCLIKKGNPQVQELNEMLREKCFPHGIDVDFCWRLFAPDPLPAGAKRGIRWDRCLYWLRMLDSFLQISILPQSAYRDCASEVSARMIDALIFDLFCVISIDDDDAVLLGNFHARNQRGCTLGEVLSTSLKSVVAILKDVSRDSLAQKIDSFDEKAFFFEAFLSWLERFLGLEGPATSLRGAKRAHDKGSGGRWKRVRTKN